MTRQACLLLLVLLVVPAGATDTELSHAETQVAAILEDRPLLASSLVPRPSLRAWVVERFELCHPPLFWSPEPPVSGRLAEVDARDSTRTYVRVGEKPSGIDQLANLIFELNNVMGYAAFEEIHERALRGEIDRDEYADLMLGQEMISLEGARELYRRELDELTPRERREARSYYSLLHGPSDVEGRVEMYLERGFDLRDHFRALFDEYVLPELEP